MQAEIDKNIIDFLNREHVQDALTYNDMQTFYKLAEPVLGMTIGKVTRVLIEAGVDPLQGMSEIPRLFLSEQQDIKEFNIPKGITAIGELAFDDSTQLESIYIPNSVEEVGRWAFNGTESLKEVRLPRGIELDTGCFARSGLESIELEDVQFTIGTYSFWQFYNCKNLKSAIIKGNTTCLPVGLFEGCSNLVYIELPAALKEVGKDTFRRCDKLREINFEGTAEQWKQIAIGEDNAGLFSYKIICNDSALRFDKKVGAWVVS